MMIDQTTLPKRPSTSPLEQPGAIRAARESDRGDIIGLMRGEALRPYARNWRAFLVFEHDGQIIGAAQMRDHSDGAREIGSLVVKRDHRGRGVATRLVASLLERHAGTAFVVTRARHARYYANQWAFRVVAPFEAPLSIRRDWFLGHYGGWLMSLLQRRPWQPLTIMARDAGRLQRSGRMPDRGTHHA